MRISMITKKTTILLSGLMAALLLTSCGGNDAKKEQTQVLVQRAVELVPMNALEIDSNFVHLLSIETMPEDATGTNTFIIPSELQPRFMVKAVDNQKFQTDLMKNKAGSTFQIYKENQIVVPYNELALQVIKCGNQEDSKELKVYTVELDQESADTNKVYLIALDKDGIITPTDLENIKEAEEKAKEDAKEAEEKAKEDSDK